MLDIVSAQVTVPYAVIVVLFVTIVVLVLVIWSIRRHRDPKLEIECDAPLERADAVADRA